MTTNDQERTQAEVIAARIAETRKRTGLTQAEFAKRLKVSRSYLSEVEALKSKPSVEMIVGVAARFPEYASPYWLLLGYGSDNDFFYNKDTVTRECIAYCFRLTKEIISEYNKKLEEKITSPDDKRKSKGKKALNSIDINHILINTYMNAYNAAANRGDNNKWAIMEGEGRASQIKATLLDDLDNILIIGPVMPFEENSGGAL